MSLKFVYHAIVYLWPDDKPEVCHFDSIINDFHYPLSEVHDEIQDSFNVENLELGKMYTVWIEGTISFHEYDSWEGRECDVEVHFNTETWSEAGEGDLHMLTATDVDPVMVFYSASPVPQPNWSEWGTAKPIMSPDDAPPTHQLWHRVDDDKRDLYQFTELGAKMPTLMDGAYFDLGHALLAKGLYKDS